MKRWMAVVLVALVTSLIHLQIYISNFGERFEYVASDLWYNLRGAVAPPDEVALVAMDEKSYQALGVPFDQAWPRRLHGQLLKLLAAAGAKRAVMDILFLGAGSNPDADQELAAGMRSLPTVIGVDTGLSEIGSGTGRIAVEEVLTPPPIFASAVETLALVRLPDDAGVARNFVMPRSRATKDYPTLAEAGAGLLRDFRGNRDERDLIHYYGPKDTIHTYSYQQVLQSDDNFRRQNFKDRVVFIGLNMRTEVGPAQKDSFATPFYNQPNMFGVEIHATVAANLMRNEWINRGPKLYETAILFVASMALGSLIVMLKPLVGSAVLFSIFGIWTAASFVGFQMGFFVPGFILVCIMLPLTYLVSTLVNYLVTRKAQQEIERAFQYYVSPDAAKQMRNNPDSLKLGGESLWATALFTDIAGFTEVTEQMRASDVSVMLNSYFSEVMNVVLDNKGTMIKFIGDAVFAIWGAPIKLEDHARRACDTALQIQREVEKFNASKRFPPLHTRVGINTGNMVVGNLGSDRRFDYTAIGDAVNLAARLEGINKYFGTSILISDSTKEEAGPSVGAFSLGSIRVAGKKQITPVFTLFDPHVTSEVAEQWQQALKDFRARKWDEAETGFEKAVELEPRLKKVAGLYQEQIATNRQNAPADEWKGEIIFSTK